MLYVNFHGGILPTLTRERLASRVNTFLRNSFVQQVYGPVTRAMWATSIEPAINEFLRVLNLEQNVKCPSKSVADGLINNAELSTVVCAGKVWAYRKDAIKYLQAVIDMLHDVFLAQYDSVLSKVIDGDEPPTVNIHLINRADASNATKGSKSRLVHMLTCLFVDFGHALGLSCDGFMQLLLCVGDCNDHIEEISEFFKRIFVPMLNSIIQHRFVLKSRVDNHDILYIQFRKGKVVLDGSLLRHASAKSVVNWRFLSPYNSLTGPELNAGFFASGKGNDLKDGIPLLMNDFFGLEPVCPTQFQAMTIYSKITSNTPSAIIRARSIYNSEEEQKFLEAETGVMSKYYNVFNGFGSNSNDDEFHIKHMVNGPWHSITTSGAHCHVRLMFELFKESGQLYAILEHYNNCLRIPVKKHSSGEIKIDGGDVLKILSLSPQTHPFVHQCALCNLKWDSSSDNDSVADAADNTTASQQRQQVVHVWWKLCHFIAICFSTQSKMVRDMFLPIIRKIIRSRDELTRLISTQSFGGATPHVLHQVVDMMFDLKNEFENSPTLGDCWEERMENFFKWFKDFVRSGNHGGSGNATVEAEATQLANSIFRSGDNRVRRQENSTKNSINAANALSRRMKHQKEMKENDLNLRLWARQRRRKCSDCSVLKVPCCLMCLQIGCVKCTDTKEGVGDAHDAMEARRRKSMATQSPKIYARSEPPCSPKRLSSFVGDDPMIPSPRSLPDTERDLDRSKQHLRQRTSIDRKKFTPKVLAMRSGQSSEGLGTDSMMFRDAMSMELDMEMEMEVEGNGNGNGNDMVNNVITKPYQHSHLPLSKYADEQNNLKEQHNEIKDLFLQTVSSYTEISRGCGIARPNAFKFWSNGHKLIFSTRTCSNQEDLQYSGKRADMTFMFNISTQKRTVSIEFTPRGNSNIKRQRMVYPFGSTYLYVKKIQIQKNKLMAIYEFSLSCISCGEAQKYVKSSKKFIGMNSNMLNEGRIRKSPYITFEVCLKLEFDEWWKKVCIFYPPFDLTEVTTLNSNQYTAFTQSLNDAILLDEAVAESLDVDADGSATICTLNIFDKDVGEVCLRQAIEIVIPRLVASLEKPKLRWGIEFCKCGKVLFIDEQGVCREWDNESVEHRECDEAFFSRLPRK